MKKARKRTKLTRRRFGSVLEMIVTLSSRGHLRQVVEKNTNGVLKLKNHDRE